MSETADTPVKARKPRAMLFVTALLVLLLLLVYGAGIIALPISILTKYQSKDCTSVLSLYKMYTRAYPGFIQDNTLASPVDECEAYGLAASHEAKGNWKDAYESYRDYSTAYPNGLYAAEAHEHGATALLNIVRDQAEGQQYDEAVANLNLIVSDYADTTVTTEAWTLYPSIYTNWGAGLREAEEFESAQQVFGEFKTWSETNQKAESETAAQREFAQTYLTWGLSLQAQKQYEEALAKFDLSISADPQSQFDSSAQAKTGQRSVYMDWGNDLLAQGEFPAAIEKFKLAISRSAGNSEAGVNDALTNGYIQWAQDFSAQEDFQAALEHLETAQQSAVSERAKESVEAAFGDTYLAFSNSSGSQARQAMREAVVSICKRHKEPELPIFGLNKDSVRFAIYGVDLELPEDVAARTPGELHYVACVEEETHTVDTRSQKVIVQRTAWGYYFMWVTQYRAQLLWNLNLRRTDTLESVASKTFGGGNPPPFPEGNTSGTYFYGPPPTVEDVVEWLLAIIK